MQNKKTLYDLLEVSQGASHEAIQAAWERVEAKRAANNLKSPDGLAPDAHYNLLKDAFYTLSDAQRRADYDRKLRGGSAASVAAISYVEQEPGMSSTTKVVLALIVVAIAIMGYRWHLGVEQERLRIRAEQVRLEQQRLEQEQARQAREDERRDTYSVESARRDAQEDERRRRQERDQAIAEADRNARRLQAADESYRREDERARYEEERQRRQQTAEAERALRDLKRQAQRVDAQYERGSSMRGGGIPLQSSSSSRRY
ncbi:hypothetical protein [Viridibacterium curvum]|uniref:J domain-containing protein n=1 Tax=Viridibacterium curvum TaxID=1101404 RepID=A0ABP9R2M0_9RHOO